MVFGRDCRGLGSVVFVLFPELVNRSFFIDVSSVFLILALSAGVVLERVDASKGRSIVTERGDVFKARVTSFASSLRPAGRLGGAFRRGSGSQNRAPRR